MDTLPIIDALDAQRAKVREYNVNYRLTHPDIYLAAWKRNNAKRIERRRENAELRAKHLTEHKIYNDTHKEQRAAYNKAYNARKRLEREAEAGRVAEAGVGA